MPDFRGYPQSSASLIAPSFIALWLIYLDSRSSFSLCLFRNKISQPNDLKHYDEYETLLCRHLHLVRNGSRYDLFSSSYFLL